MGWIVSFGIQELLSDGSLYLCRLCLKPPQEMTGIFPMAEVIIGQLLQFFNTISAILIASNKCNLEGVGEGKWVIMPSYLLTGNQ
ncbi:MAG: hypothetical protein AABZ14_00790 [Candidatus Margulisiibacteriota bacterium]